MADRAPHRSLLGSFLRVPTGISTRVMALSLAFRLLSCVLALACGGGSSEPVATPKPTQLLVSPTTLVFNQGDAVEVRVKVVDQNGFEMPSVPYSVVSKDTTVITIGPTFVATASGRHGSTEVVVTAEGLTRTISFTVNQAVSKAIFQGAQATLRQLESVDLHPRAVDQVGVEVPGAVMVFSVNDPTIATVSPAGVLRSLGPPGEIAVLAVGFVGDTRFLGSMSIKVVQVAAQIALSTSVLQVGQGTSNAITATVLDRISQPILSAPLTFASADPSLVQVTGAGVVYSVGGQGQTTVTVALLAENLSRTVTVTVGPFVRSGWNLIASVPAPHTWDVVASPNGTFFATNLSGTATKGSWQTLAATGTLAGAPPSKTEALTSTGGALFFGGNGNEAVRAIDPVTGNELWSALGDFRVYTMGLSSDDATLYATTDATLHAIDVATHQEKWSVLFNSVPDFLAVHPSQGLVYVGGQIGTIEEINVVTHAVRAILLGGPLARQLPSPDGTQLYVLHLNDNSLQVLSIPTYQEVRRLPIGCNPYDMIHSPSGLETFVSCIAPTRLLVLDQGATRIRKALPLSGIPRRLAISPDGRTLLVANEGGWVDIIR